MWFILGHIQVFIHLDPALAVIFVSAHAGVPTGLYNSTRDGDDAMWTTTQLASLSKYKMCVIYTMPYLAWLYQVSFIALSHQVYYCMPRGFQQTASYRTTCILDTITS